MLNHPSTECEKKNEYGTCTLNNSGSSRIVMPVRLCQKIHLKSSSAGVHGVCVSSIGMGQMKVLDGSHEVGTPMTSKNMYMFAYGGKKERPHIGQKRERFLTKSLVQQHKVKQKHRKLKLKGE